MLHTCKKYFLISEILLFKNKMCFRFLGGFATMCTLRDWTHGPNFHAQSHCAAFKSNWDSQVKIKSNAKWSWIDDLVEHNWLDLKLYWDSSFGKKIDVPRVLRRDAMSLGKYVFEYPCTAFQLKWLGFIDISNRWKATKRKFNCLILSRYSLISRVLDLKPQGHWFEPWY